MKSLFFNKGISFMLLSGAAGGAAAVDIGIQDSFRGSLALGAVGDAWGAAWEILGMNGEACVSSIEGCSGDRLLPFCSLYDDKVCRGYAQPWGIWSDPEAMAAARVVGVSTDDTAFRVGLHLPESLALAGAGTGPWQEAYVNETVMMGAFLKVSEGGSPRPEMPPVAAARRRGMAADFVTMMSIVGVDPSIRPNPAGKNAFYVKGEPACFGLYMFLQGAPLFASRSVAENFDTFARATRLDQDYGGAVTGAVCATSALAAATAPAPGSWRGSFCPFFVNATVAALAGAMQSHPHARLVSERVSFAVSAGRALAQKGGYGASRRVKAEKAQHVAGSVVRSAAGDSVAADDAGDDAFLARWGEIYRDPHETPQHPLRNSDPLAQVMLMTMACAFAEDDAVRAVGLTARAAGDSDTTASFLALVLGSFAGYKAVSADPILAPMIIETEQYLGSRLGVNATQLADRVIAAASATTR